ncbi:MAG: multidrug ABC transporter substrate-binding protein, partial [Acidobacteria bacterium]
MNAFFRKLNWLVHRSRKEDELSEELQFHLDEEAEERRAEGLAEQEARWAARRELGNVTLVQETTRAMWTWTCFEQLVQDLRYALGTMIHNRAFTALAALSLALGIGANTAIYSFMDSILLRSLPVSNPESLVVLNWHNKVYSRGTVVRGASGTIYDDPKSGSTAGIFPFPAFELLRKSDAVFS